MSLPQPEVVQARVLDAGWKKPGFTGMERVILTSDGNLQRTMSAFYNSPVTMEIKKFERRGDTTSFDREVLLSCKGKVFCCATTLLSVTSDEVLELLVEKQMGFGQIFRYLQRIPVFQLLDCGKDSQKIWRHYTLTIPEGMHMIITEVFPTNVFELDFEGKDEFTPEIWTAVPKVEEKL